MSNISDEPLASTAQRTLRLVELLLANPGGLGPQELQTRLDISRSTLFLLLNTLKQSGYVEQSEKRGRYRAGPRLQAWRGASPQHLGGSAADLSQTFYQEAEQRAWSETLILVVTSPGGPLVLAQVEGSQRVRASFLTGQIYPPSTGGFPGLQAADQALAAEPSDEIRTNGYALASFADTFELALPVCRDGRRPDAVLALSVPAYRWKPEALLEAFLPDLRMMAARLSYRLGASFYTPYQVGETSNLRPTSPLSSAEIGAFLAGPWTARLACVRPDGRPHVIPVWQEWDGHYFTVITWQGSQWAAYLRQNPNVSLTVDEPWSPLRRVSCRGTAAAIDDPASLPVLTERLARRYLGQPAPGLADLVEGAFRILPDSIRGFQGLS